MTQPPRPDDDQYQLSTLIRRVLSVGDVGLRRRQMERHLLTVDAATAAAHLEALFGPALSGDFEPGFYVKHIIKDILIALKSARECDLEMPGLEKALWLFEKAAALGWEECGTQVLYRLYSER
jgi:3-hydroxyisobutyrate dehydrogenase-like beta-hydroxyacid dehydrogenase